MVFLYKWRNVFVEPSRDSEVYPLIPLPKYSQKKLSVALFLLNGSLLITDL